MRGLTRELSTEHNPCLKMCPKQKVTNHETNQQWNYVPTRTIVSLWVLKEPITSLFFQGNILSTIPLAKYLFRFQNYVDNFRGHPIKPTNLICTETLLAAINAWRYSYVWHMYYGSTSPKPSYSHLKVDLQQSEKPDISLWGDYSQFLQRLHCYLMNQHLLCP